MNPKTETGVSAGSKNGISAGESLEDIIKRHPFLDGMSPHQHRLLADCAMQAHFRADELIFRDGDPANRFYLIQNGKVALESFVHGRTAIMVTHRLSTLALADRVLVMEAGRICGGGIVSGATYARHFDVKSQNIFWSEGKITAEVRAQQNGQVRSEPLLNYHGHDGTHIVVTCEYRMHAFHKVQQEEAKRQRWVWAVGALVLSGSLVRHSFCS